MAIYQLLQEGSFDEHEIKRLAQSYEAALTLLRLKDRSDPVTNIIAAKIIQVYRLGEHDPSRLCARALKELGVPIPD